jgi:hypothetical protein
MTAAKSPSGRLFDENYHQKSAQLHLHLHLSKSHLFASYFDAELGKYIGIQNTFLGEHENWFSVENEIYSLIQKHFPPSFKKVKIAISDKLYTLVPKALFQEESIENFLNFNHELDKNEAYSFHFEEVAPYDTSIVYAIPTGLKEKLEKHFTTVSWHSHIAPFLEMTAFEKKVETQLLLNIQHLGFDCLFLKEGKLQFLNSFECKNVDDFIYFLLYVMEQLHLDRESSQVYLQGSFEEKSTLFEMLYKYIRNLHIASRNDTVQYSLVLNELPQQYYKNLFSLHLCE